MANHGDSVPTDEAEATGAALSRLRGALDGVGSDHVEVRVDDLRRVLDVLIDVAIDSAIRRMKEARRG